MNAVASPRVSVSYEPALGPVDWRGWEFTRQIISGGESGPRARPALTKWFRDTRDWCEATGVAYFHKQNGEFLPLTDPHGVPSEWWNSATDTQRGNQQFLGGSAMIRVGKKVAGRLLDGREHSEFPTALAKP